MSQDQYLLYAASGSLGAGYFEIIDPANTLATLQVEAKSGTGVASHSIDGIGISGVTDSVSDSAAGLYAKCSQGNQGFAAQFVGKVDIAGTLTKSGGQFRIDHPDDPANKYLSHAFVESSEMKNIYDGVVILDTNGEAVVKLPDWFEALNKDIRYQLTCIGGYSPIYIAQKLQDKHFKIAGGTAGLEVCWQVTGVRQDAYANMYPLVVEEEKPEAERGFYRHPELYHRPEEQGIEWQRLQSTNESPKQ